METIKEILSKNYQTDSQPVSEWSDVELSEEETKEILDIAKQKKFDLIESERKMKMREEIISFYKRPWMIAEFREFIRSRMASKGLAADDANRNVLNALALYFNNETEFESLQGLNAVESPLSLKKGIFLFGPVGTGKTTIMELFAANKKQSYQVISCRKLVSEYIKNGEEVIEPLHKGSYYFAKSIDNFYHEKMGICFDDLGTESETANNYGNKRNVLEQVILDRYDNHLDFPLTHITSNLSPEMIGERYGARVKSRMREMFNIIELLGTDRRR